MSVTLTAARGPRRAEKLAYLAYQIRRSPLTMAGLLITSIVLLCMIFAPWLASHDPNALNLGERLAPPSADHWFGTDEVGRDLFSRVLFGSQQSVGVGLFVAFASCFIGGLLGCFSG
jgi:peptide/nickel transport system permease protein